MTFEIEGKIIAALPVKTGTGAKGEWKMASYVIEEVGAEYPKSCVFDVFGSEKIDKFALKVGDVVKAKLETTAREYQGKYFNSVKCWFISKGEGQNNDAPAQAAPQSAPAEEKKDDLPF